VSLFNAFNLFLLLLSSSRSQKNPLMSELFLPAELIMNTQRDRLAFQLLHSEQKYVRNLNILVQTWKDPLASRIISRSIVTVTEAQFLTLFGNIEDLILVNTTLLSSVVSRLRRWSDTQILGDIFILLEPDLRYARALN
jgi:hypothetical protein